MSQANAITGKHILLVEDEQSMRETLRLLLWQDAHTVCEANNGAEAWILFRKAQYDLVVTDFEMPFIRGDELAIKIKQFSPSLPILMITGYSPKPGRHNPVDAVINKPFDSACLRAAMTRLFTQPAT